MKCEHPLQRIVWRGGPDVWCWACRRWLPEPESWLVIKRCEALGAGIDFRRPISGPGRPS